ncbi:polysaccharide deacetylase [Desulfoluna limicola]|uniref:Polysaccharide deacetylase n=1 Tax=Desulfoluna limicola TaxID=2810562 RepID=A0ABM7PIA2_9BACT|nr:DUF3473 domain-containing protein [Desulfoluna limicola]BCS97102.1 polysaccharide deacetylase [Desulfoluna limicola]
MKINAARHERNKPVFLMTVDVEDWFQVENFKPWISYDSWDRRELRVEKNTLAILDLFDSVLGAGRIKGTFFLLGWVAERLPHLVKEIDARGHEVASHGYHHRMVSTCTDAELLGDLVVSRRLLEGILGKKVAGYRAPSFSIEPRLVGALKKAGYRYDSSYNSFNGNHRYGSLKGHNPLERGVIQFNNGISELPVSNLSFRGKAVPWGGGGFFRLIPKGVYAHGVKAQMDREGVFLFYLHPWELDPDQPRVTEASSGFKFRHYINLSATEKKLNYLLSRMRDASFMTCSAYLERSGNQLYGC